MSILILYLEDSIAQLIQVILQEEGYNVTSLGQAAEALHIIEDSGSHYVVITDNFTLNGEAVEALHLLYDRPEMRRRTRIIGITAMAGQGPIEWVSAGAIDEFITMPFTPMHLIGRVEANAVLLAQR